PEFFDRVVRLTVVALGLVDPIGPLEERPVNCRDGLRPRHLRVDHSSVRRDRLSCAVGDDGSEDVLSPCLLGYGHGRRYETGLDSAENAAALETVTAGPVGVQHGCVRVNTRIQIRVGALQSPDTL